ncbi:MAG: hypothetical protein V4717_09865 [Bacteroidota bacterium]
MKKILLSLVLVSSSLTVVIGQNYDDVKNLLYLKSYKKAKEMLDKNWSNAKFIAKPEAYILKASVLAGLSADSSMAGESAALRSQALEALKKYREMDPKMTLAVEQGSVYSSAPISMYGGYFNEGISSYQKKDWPAAFQNFKTAVELSDLLKEYKLADIKLDTNAILLAGASAQSMKNDDEAEKLFVRLADAKVGGAENEFLYQFLTNRSLTRGDMTSFNKYLALGKEIYPQSKYFQYDEIDYILAIENEAEKTKLIDEKLAKNPDDYKLQSAYAEMLFDRLNPKDTAVPMPANFDEIESKMVASFTKATELKPESGLGMSNIANHYINKSNKLGKRLDSIRVAIREKNKANKPATAPKPGTKPAPSKVSPEDAALRDEITKQYEAAGDKAREYYEKAVNIYSKLPSPTSLEKQQYRNAVSYLIDLTAEKKNNSKGTPALYDKWEKEEKKWSDIYHKM